MKPFRVPWTSRLNAFVNAEAPELIDESFGAVIEAISGAGIFVERAMYSDSQGAPGRLAGVGRTITDLPRRRV